MIGGLILAAGAGTRFGGSAPKQLADLHGRPLLEWAIAAQSAVPAIDRIVVVVGSRAEEVLAGVNLMDAESVVCEDWERGQAASLRCGVRALKGARKVIVTLGDAPLVTPQVVAMMVDHSPRSRAVYDGQPGHPVVLGPREMEAVTALDGDRGAASLLKGGRRIEAGHLCSGRDVDTPEDLEDIRNEARAVI